MSVVADQYLWLSRRSILGLLRQPAEIAPSVTFPLLFLAINSASLAEAVRLPGFPPVDSYLQFAIATTTIQGALFASITAGIDMARDIEGGFFERLIASPVARTSIVVGRVTGVAVVAFLQAWLFFGITSLFGLEVEGGFPAMLAVATVAALVAAGMGAISLAIGLRTGSSEVVQGSFPLLFSLMFLSSAFFPRSLMDGWFKTAASWNPISHMIEGLRYQVIARFDVGELALSAAIAGGLFLIGTVASGRALRARLAQRR